MLFSYARTKTTGGRQPPEINTRRCVYQVDALQADNKADTAVDRPVKKCKKKRKWSEHVRRTVPSVDWLFLNYRWTEDLMEDTMAGITVAVLNIPQGMAYSIMGNVEPIVGLYMAVFPVIIYALLGTSKHISLGALSVVCLMTGKVVNTYAVDPQIDPNGYTPIQVATAVTLVVGLVQLLMYVFQLGILSTVLSETIVSGFTGAVAIIVFTSQLKELLGVDTICRRGVMSVPYTYYDFVNNFHRINWMTTAVSTTTVITLLVYNSYFKDRINKRLCIPMPIELMVTIFTTVLFQVTTIAEDYNMVQMGELKSGLPGFEVPPLKLFPSVLLDACIIALVAYSITMSLALLVSEKLKYPLDHNQELLAMGLGNVIGAFFSCLPSGGSPSRSASQQTVGGKTQLASVVSAGIIIVVLLWIGVVFEPLPRCVLSSIVVVALKGIMMQVFDLPKIWRRSRTDGIVWMVTYVSVIIFDIDAGLLVGIVVSLLFVFTKGVLNEVHVLGRLPDTDLYVRLDLFNGAVEVPGVKIVQYIGSLNVLNRFVFKRKVMAAVKATGNNGPPPITVSVVGDAVGKDVTTNGGDHHHHHHHHHRPPTVVLDLAALQYADAAGAKILSELIESLTSDRYDVNLAAVPDSPMRYIRGRGSGPMSVRFFPTVHDAVVFHQCNSSSNHNNGEIAIGIPPDAQNDAPPTPPLPTKTV